MVVKSSKLTIMDLEKQNIKHDVINIEMFSNFRSPFNQNKKSFNGNPTQ